MKKQKDHWKELLPYEKAVSVAFWLFLCTAMITLFVDILHENDAVWAGSSAAMAATLACQGVLRWRKERSRAWVNIVCAIFLALTTVLRIVMLFS